MKWSAAFSIALVVFGCGKAPTSSLAASSLLFESTQMGSPGAPGGFSISSDQFLGARFHLESGATIDAIGGHLSGGGQGNGLIFGSLIALTSITDVPNSADFSTPDVLAVTAFQPPSGPSSDVSAPIGPISVPAGDYAVVFGSGFFGATGNAVAPDDNVPSDVNAARSLAYHVGSPFGWDVIGNRGVRFTAYGIVPEPSGIGYVALTLLALRWRRMGHC